MIDAIFPSFKPVKKETEKILNPLIKNAREYKRIAWAVSALSPLSYPTKICAMGQDKPSANIVIIIPKIAFNIKLLRSKLFNSKTSPAPNLYPAIGLEPVLYPIEKAIKT